MRNITFSNFFITVVELLLIFLISESFGISFHEFRCLNKKGNVPELPKAYSTNVKLNFVRGAYTVEMKYSKSSKEKTELIELRKSDRHVKYIIREDEGATLYIEYQDNKQPTCAVIKSIYFKDFLKKEDAGEKNMLLKTLEVMLSPSEYNIYSSGPFVETGVAGIQYEGCLTEPRLNISMTLAVKKWKMPHSTSSLDVSFPETVTSQIDDDIIVAFYSNFDPSEPDNSLFQPSSDIFCKGFRTKKLPPKMPDVFSYNAELINYKIDKKDIVPFITQEEVYYDYKDNISRIDFNDLLPLDDGSFSETAALKSSIIHDFNSGVQYIIDFSTGKCSIDSFEGTFDVMSFQLTKKGSKMRTGVEYFLLDNVETSYNGQFNLRGVVTDVYTALLIDPNTKNPNIISWFFSTEKTQVVENDNVEKNVLLSMSIRPETEFGKEEKAEIHIFDFVSKEPDVFNFDLTKCFNESSSKTLVFTFPVYDPLRGSEKLIGKLLNIAIKETTGIRKHRIFTKEVIFSGKYMYSEFSLLEDSAVKAKSTSKEISLEEALQKLKDSVSKGEFQVKVPIENTIVVLKPEPNGLNIFAGDRPRISNDEGYKEGSVIGITLGMLLLGFLLGGLTINLVISRKYGVSLFQSRFGGKGNQQPLSENTF